MNTNSVVAITGTIGLVLCEFAIIAAVRGYSKPLVGGLLLGGAIIGVVAAVFWIILGRKAGR